MSFRKQHEIDTIEVYRSLRTYIPREYVEHRHQCYVDVDWTQAEHGCEMDAPELLPDAGWKVYGNNRGRRWYPAWVRR